MTSAMTSDATNDDLSAIDLIAEARRPILIERHRRIIEEMEGCLSDAMVSGETDNPRLLAILRELEVESERARIARTLRILAEDDHFKDSTLRNSLVEQLCLLREEGSIEVAMLQMHVLGVYRAVRSEVAKRQGDVPSLADLRELPTAILGRLLNAHPPEFGSPTLPESLVYTTAFAERSLRTSRRLRRPEDADTTWNSSDGEPTLPQDQEELLLKLPDSERHAARKLMIRQRIRHDFYHGVFLRYLSRDELDPKEVESHPTVLHWLESIESTAHLYSFMQGQSTAQKRFRLSQLVEKIVQLHEVYARIALASQHPSYREAFVDLKTRGRLAIMAKEHVPPLQLTADLMLAALLCPFGVFATWVQERVINDDLVLPPDRKH